MKIKYLILLFCFLLLRSKSQTTLFSEDFESYGANFTLAAGSASWNVIQFTASNNRWEVNNAACRINGNRSLMVTNNGTTCQYRKNDNCDKIARNATDINATGYSCMNLTFNWKCVGEEAGNGVNYYDYLLVYYSVNGGTNWFQMSGPLVSQATTQSVTLGLPTACDNAANLRIGFDWINDGTLGADVPAIIDDIVLVGYAAPSAPANDACANAVNMTFTSGTATATGDNLCATSDLVSSACFNANRNVWYKFTATTTNNYVELQTGTMTVPCMSIIDFATACSTVGDVEVDCIATLATNASTSLCGLTVGDEYYIMVDNYTYGKPGTYTLSVKEPIVNDLSSTPSIINSCGTSFTSSTIGATNCGDCDASFNDLDCNNATGGFAGGGDVGFSVENSSWYVFCATGVSSYTVTMMNTGGCTGTDGLQIAAFTGTPGNLTLQSGGTAGMNILSGNSFVTSAIALTAGNCAYIAVDGFAGTNCNYSLNVAAAPSCILPMELIYFKGYKLGKSNLLKWATANEHNNLKYLIEKSNDGYNFNEIGELPGSMNSNVQLNYSFTDEKPFEKRTYYRIKQIDTDGGFTFTNVIYIDENTINENFELLDVTPNPNNGMSTINFMIPRSGQLTYVVYDLKGVKMLEESVNVEEGSLKREINISNLKDGVYFIWSSFDNISTQNKYIIKNSNY